MTTQDIALGQIISTEIFFRSGRNGGGCDFAKIQGTVVEKMECYNSILVDVDNSESFNSPSNSVWINLNKSKIILIN